MKRSSDESIRTQTHENLSVTHVMPSLPRVHIHLLSSDWERHLWSPKYIKFPCVCVYFHPDISSFFGEFSCLLISIVNSSIVVHALSYWSNIHFPNVVKSSAETNIADKPQCWLKVPFHRAISTIVMCTDVSQVDVALFPSF